MQPDECALVYDATVDSTVDDRAWTPHRALTTLVCACLLAGSPVACFSEQSDQDGDDDDETSADASSTSPTATTTRGDSSDQTSVTATEPSTTDAPTTGSTSSATDVDPSSTESTDATTGGVDPLCPDEGPVACGDGVAVPGEVCLDQTQLTATSTEQHDRIVIADITGDALPDAVVGDGSVGYVLFENDGSGSFTSLQGTPLLAWTIDAAPVIEDEPAYVLVGGFDTESLLLRYAKAVGGFAVEQSFLDPGGGAVIARFIDFDGANGPDVVTASSAATSDQIHVYVGDGLGGFAEDPLTIDIQGGGSTTLEDLRGIEDPAYDTAALVMLVADGRLLLWRDGALDSVENGDEFLPLGRPVLVDGDLDGDMFDDIVVASSGRAYLYAYDPLDQGLDGAGVLGEGVGTRVSAAVGDVDRNGRVDVVLAEYPSSTVYTYLRGDAGFGEPTEIDLGPLAQPIGVAVGNIDEDCAADLLIFSSDTLWAFISEP
jgi:hypothetical protein